MFCFDKSWGFNCFPPSLFLSLSSFFFCMKKKLILIILCIPIGLGMPFKYWLLSYVLSIIYGFFKFKNYGKLNTPTRPSKKISNDDDYFGSMP